MNSAVDTYNLLLGTAAAKLWPELPRDVQEQLFETAVPDDAAVRNSLAVFLHERHPRTQHPPNPVKSPTPLASAGGAVEGTDSPA